jgi:cytochrome c
MSYLRVLFLFIPLFLFACEKESVVILENKQGGDSSADIPSLTIKNISKMPRQMRHCTPCHSIKKGAKNKIGPNLFGVVGSEVGLVPGYKYSREYKEGKWLWTRENLDLLINKKYGTLEEAVRKLTGDPKARTKMKFYGAADKDAQKILDYLESLKDAG